MSYFVWDESLNTGIPVIDSQHRRIVDYINQLQDAISTDNESMVQEVLDDLVDYTVSHFSFEEHLQEQAQYANFETHKKTHEKFTQRIQDYQERFHGGEDIAETLLSDLRDWLIKHIKQDDADYVGVAKAKIETLDKGWMSKTLSKIFGE
jgi:hemerythrin